MKFEKLVGFTEAGDPAQQQGWAKSTIERNLQTKEETMKSQDLKKAVWMLRGFADALETDLARRIGDERAVQYCMSLHLALNELDGLRRDLDRLDELSMDCPGHRQFYPYPEV